MHRHRMWSLAVAVITGLAPRTALTQDADDHTTGGFMPMIGLEKDEHHSELNLSGDLAFTTYHAVRASGDGLMVDGHAGLHYASQSYEVSSADAAHGDEAPHGSKTIALDGHLHLIAGGWAVVPPLAPRSVWTPSWKLHGFSIWLGGEVKPTGGETYVDRAFRGSIGYGFAAVAPGATAAERFDPDDFRLTVHVGLGMGYWSVPHAHIRTRTCGILESDCESGETVRTAKPETTDFWAFQLPVFLLQGRGGDVGFNGAIELRGLPDIERVAMLRLEVGVSPKLSQSGNARFDVTLRFEVDRSSASVHAYPEHGPDIHLAIGPRIAF